jgi:hypothetical protein
MINESLISITFRGSESSEELGAVNYSDYEEEIYVDHKQRLNEKDVILDPELKVNSLQQLTDSSKFLLGHISKETISEEFHLD